MFRQSSVCRQDLTYVTIVFIDPELDITDEIMISGITNPIDQSYQATMKLFFGRNMD